MLTFFRCVRQSDLADKMRGYFNLSVTPNQLEEKVNQTRNQQGQARNSYLELWSGL